MPASEIEECRTAESVAWNFITSIVEKQWNKMEQLMAPLYKYQLRQDMNSEGLYDYNQVFSSEYIHDITDIRPLLAMGYKLVITKDNEGIGVWLGTDAEQKLDALVCTVDLVKRDSEIKLLIGCTPVEKSYIKSFYNEWPQIGGILIERK